MGCYCLRVVGRGAGAVVVGRDAVMGVRMEWKTVRCGADSTVVY